MGKHLTSFIWGLGEVVVPHVKGGSSISALLLQDLLFLSGRTVLAIVEMTWVSVLSLGMTFFSCCKHKVRSRTQPCLEQASSSTAGCVAMTARTLWWLLGLRLLVSFSY